MANNPDIDTELLIGHVENRRNLWDTTHENYKNRDIRQKTWEDVTASLMPEFESLPETEKTKAVDKIQKRWKAARDSFVRCRSKGKTAKSASKKYNKYVFYENMKFLESTIDQNSALSNCSESEDLQMHPQQTILKPTIIIPEKPADKPDVVVQAMRKTNPKAQEKPRKKDFEETLIELMTKSDQQFNEDRSFFESLLPTLSNFNEDQKIQFRIDVLNTILRIKNDTPANSNVGSYLPHPNFEMKMSPSSRSSTFSPATNYERYTSPPPDLSSSPPETSIKNGMEDEED